MMFNGYDEYEFNSESFYEMANKADPTNGSPMQSEYGIRPFHSTTRRSASAPDSTRTAMSYGNQYMHDRNLPRFGYTDAAPLAEGHVLSETKPDGSLRYSLSKEYTDQQLAHRKKLGKWEPGEPDPRLFVCSLQPFVDSVR